MYFCGNLEVNQNELLAIKNIHTHVLKHNKITFTPDLVQNL